MICCSIRIDSLFANLTLLKECLRTHSTGIQLLHFRTDFLLNAELTRHFFSLDLFKMAFVTFVLARKC